MHYRVTTMLSLNDPKRKPVLRQICGYPSLTTIWQMNFRVFPTTAMTALSFPQSCQFHHGSLLLPAPFSFGHKAAGDGAYAAHTHIGTLQHLGSRQHSFNNIATKSSFLAQKRNKASYTKTDMSTNVLLTPHAAETTLHYEQTIKAYINFLGSLILQSLCTNI